MTLEEVFKNTNANGEYYLSDVHKWLSEDIDIKIVKLIHKKLNEYKRRTKW